MKRPSDPPEGRRGVVRRRRRFAAATVGASWYALVVVVLPVLCLVVLGLVTLWREGQLLVLLGGWLAATLLGYAVFVNLPHRRARRVLDAERAALEADAEGGSAALDGEDLPEQLAERPDWSERDSAVWQRRCTAIERTLAGDPPWDDFPELALAELEAVATEYHGAKANARLRFTLPEGLLVISVASERYRRVVTDHVPFVDRITVATLFALREREAQIRRGVRWLDRARRTVRLANHAGALIGELRDQFTSRVLDETGASLQQDLKRLLLQEVAQVGIDLYSGRLKTSDAELAGYVSRAAREDETRRPEAAEPLRVVLVGQVSAGKSSLVNALAETLEAEVDLLPTTDRTTAHALTVEDDDGGSATLHLVDTPGIDEDPEQVRRLVDVAREADLILWTARANQPARSPDERLHAALERWFDAHPERRLPPRLLALTHVDRLPPRGEWAPPYDLERGEGKAETIRRALLAAREAIGFEAETPAVPLSLVPPDGEPYNVEAIAGQIMALADVATLAQFNRRRVERGAGSGGWRARWRQTRRLGLAMGRSVVRRVAREDGTEEDAARGSDGGSRDDAR